MDMIKGIKIKRFTITESFVWEHLRYHQKWGYIPSYLRKYDNKKLVEWNHGSRNLSLTLCLTQLSLAKSWLLKIRIFITSRLSMLDLATLRLVHCHVGCTTQMPVLLEFEFLIQCPLNLWYLLRQVSSGFRVHFLTTNLNFDTFSV